VTRIIQSPRKIGRQAFTLVQLIGVLSVIAILASVIAPTVIKRVDQAARDAEETSMAAMSESLMQYSLNSRTITSASNFPVVVASYLNVKTNTILTNKRGLARTFFSDPALILNGTNLPFAQTSAGIATRPANIRAMLISSVAKALPSAVTNFDDLWITAKGIIPTSLTNWGGRGEDLVIARIEFAPQFHKVVLMNVERTAAGIYSIDSFPNNSLPAQTNFSAYYLDGTVLNLCQSDGTISYRETVRSDVSFVYQTGLWGAQVNPDNNSNGDFGQLVDRFLQGPAPCDPDAMATQRAVVNLFYDYLWGYADWAFGDSKAVPVIPPFAGSNTNNTPQYPSYTVVSDAQIHMSGSQKSFILNLIK
jgi:type II secretory pathway pseudopilin PulG